ncbi:hypothetical protein [Cloacibacterium sp.]|uniref:hypothetical protein n=1 Tax=Cloacibacterium sp. TaxID=1913682 RepID=UPI0039E266ED
MESASVGISDFNSYKNYEKILVRGKKYDLVNLQRETSNYKNLFNIYTDLKNYKKT